MVEAGEEALAGDGDGEVLEVGAVQLDGPEVGVLEPGQLHHRDLGQTSPEPLKVGVRKQKQISALNFHTWVAVGPASDP